MNDNLVNESGDLVNDLVNDTISRQAAVQTAERMYERCDTGNVEDYHDLMVEALTVLPSAQPSVSKTEIIGDTISRQAAINVVRKAKDKSEAHRMLIQLPSAQPSISCHHENDMVSRRAAINEILDDLKDTSLHDDPATPEDFAEGYDEGIRNAAAIVLQMPPAQPVVISKSENTTECEDAVPRASVEYICRKNTVSTNPYEHKYHDKFMQFMDDPEISDFGRWQHSNGFNTALVAVKCDLDKVPSVTPKQPGWIPVTEKPIEGGQYIVTLKDDKEVWTDIAEWNPTFGGRWQAEFFDCEYRDIDNVVAWMPLPKPWEGENA